MYGSSSLGLEEDRDPLPYTTASRLRGGELEVGGSHGFSTKKVNKSFQISLMAADSDVRTCQEVVGNSDCRLSARRTSTSTWEIMTRIKGFMVVTKRVADNKNTGRLHDEVYQRWFSGTKLPSQLSREYISEEVYQRWLSLELNTIHRVSSRVAVEWATYKKISTNVLRGQRSYWWCSWT